MKPITYKPNPDCEGGMEVHRYGNYVSEAEYNELKKQVELLTKAGDAMYYYLLSNSKITANQWEVRNGWDYVRNNRLTE